MSFKISTGFVDSCFKDCVNNYSSADFSSSEKSCLMNCGKRTAKMMEATAEMQQMADKL